MGSLLSNWVPALTRASITRGVNDKIDPPWWISLLTLVKLPYVIFACVVVWLAWQFLH